MGTVVEQLWPDATVVCLGSGPSLVPEDVDYVRGKARVIAVNSSYRLAPWADCLYACDAVWWSDHQGVPSFMGLKYTSTWPEGVTSLTGLKYTSKSKWPDVQTLERTGREGLERERTGLRTGQNSGFQAINLAVHFGARLIVLLGYDMQSAQGKHHWHSEQDGYPPPPYTLFRDYFDTIVEPLKSVGVGVVNCSRRTALTAFPCQQLREVLT